jgi:hypothetical protein
MRTRYISRRLKMLVDSVGYVLAAYRALPTPRYGQLRDVFTIAQ